MNLKEFDLRVVRGLGVGWGGGGEEEVSYLTPPFDLPLNYYVT